MQHLSSQPQAFIDDKQPAMNPDSTSAVTPFNFLGLPQEIRNEIYEITIFDFSPPQMFLPHRQAITFAYRNMNANILLTSRQAYWEARDVIVRRGQLVMVSATRLHRELYPYGGKSPSLFVEILTGWAGITVIHPKYRNLCIMNHHINAARSCRRPEPEDAGSTWEFIIHQRDIRTFCQSLMGKFNIHSESILGPRSTHTLVLHCPPGYAQHECTSLFAMQTRVLQKYRTILRGFEDVSIRGTSTGWESGLYSATLEDIRSTDAKVPAQFIDDVIDDLIEYRNEGLDILSQTGDLEAADASWIRALGVFDTARRSFRYSFRSSPPYFERTSLESNAQLWAQIRRLNGNACAVPIIVFWYGLTRLRLLQILRFIRRGGHLATSHGRGPRPASSWATFTSMVYRESARIARDFEVYDWMPQPSEEAEMCCIVATILRRLDVCYTAKIALEAIRRAVEVAPEDESVQRKAVRTEAWIKRLVDRGEFMR